MFQVLALPSTSHSPVLPLYWSCDPPVDPALKLENSTFLGRALLISNLPPPSLFFSWFWGGALGWKQCSILSCILSSQGRSLTGAGLGHDQLGNCRTLKNPLVTTAPRDWVPLHFYSLSLAHRAPLLVANSQLETIGSLMSDVPIPRG